MRGVLGRWQPGARPPGPRSAPGRWLATGLLLVLVLGAGCGGGDDGEDDGSADEREVRQVIRSSLTTKNPEGDCRKWLSDSLVARTYRTRSRCVRVQRDDDDEPARAVRFASVEVNGEGATADIEIRGGDSDGARGALELVREEGAWRIEEISIPLLRSLVEAGVRAGDAGEDLPPGSLECLAAGLRALPDAELRAVTYAAIGETRYGQRRILDLFTGCESSGGRSILRQIFEHGVTESLRESGSSAAQVECILRELRARVADEDLAALLAGSTAELEQLGEAAATACAEADAGPA